MAASSEDPGFVDFAHDILCRVGVLWDPSKAVVRAFTLRLPVCLSIFR